jgi:hypothetical protein
MPAVEGVEEDVDVVFDSGAALEELAGDAGVAELDEPDELELPQPAATSARRTSVSAASLGPVLLVARLNIVAFIGPSPLARSSIPRWGRERKAGTLVVLS